MKLRTLSLHEDKQNPLFNSPECQQLIEIYADYYPKTGFELPWVAYLIVHDDIVVGTASFTGRPVDGVVEIAYWTFKAFEGQGIASFACRELISIAQKADPTVLVTAKTAPETNASTSILERNGFVRKGVVQDEEIGDAWFWALPPQQ